MPVVVLCACCSVVVVVVVEVPQTIEDDHHENSLELRVVGGQVGACVLMVMAMVVGVGAEMEVVDGKHAEQCQDGSVACREMPENLPSVR